MKKLVGNRMYDTEKSKCIAVSPYDFYEEIFVNKPDVFSITKYPFEKSLYKTVGGEWFEVYKTINKTVEHNIWNKITVLTPQMARTWLSDNDQFETLMEHFKRELQLD